MFFRFLYYELGDTIHFPFLCKKAIYKLRQQVQSSDNLLFETALHFLQMYCCLHITQHPLDAENPGVFVVYYYKQNYRVLQIWKRTIDYPPLFAYYL